MKRPGGREGRRGGATNAFAQRGGDTFCEGDHPNLTVKRLACSTRVSNGVTKNCELIVEGSYATVTASTGTLKTKVKSVACKLLGRGTADQLSFTINNPIDQNPLLEMDVTTLSGRAGAQPPSPTVRCQLVRSTSARSASAS